MSDWLVRAFTFKPYKNRGVYRDCELTSPTGRVLRIYESPTGRRLRVFVDGEEWTP